MMKPEEIIEGLKYTVAMCEYDSLTGDIIERCFMNEMTRTTYDACKAAIEFIEKHQYVHDKCKKCIEFSEFKKQPCEDVVSIGVFEQVKWERDVAIEQLEQLGYSLGEKIRTSEDYISRAEAINVVHKYFMDYLKLNDDICLDGIRSMPSVTPSIPDVENDFNLGYNCGYADAMNDIAESEENDDDT